MKRTILSALAFSVLAATAVPGQTAPLNQPHVQQSNVVDVDYRRHGSSDYRKHGPSDYRRHGPYAEEKTVIIKRKVAKRPYWKRGQRYSDWRRHRPVRDYHRYGLHRPHRGQQWIRVGNDYLLVSLLTGVIAGVAIAH